MSKRFSIEFYPLSNRYYPMVDGQYLRVQYQNPFDYENLGSVNTEINFRLAAFRATEAEAREIIAVYKEQHLKENVVTIEVE